MFELNPASNAHELCYHCSDGGPYNNKNGLNPAFCNAYLNNIATSLSHSQFTGFTQLINLSLCLDTVNILAIEVNTQTGGAGIGHATPGYCPPSFIPYTNRPFIMGEPAIACNNMARC